MTTSNIETSSITETQKIVQPSSVTKSQTAVWLGRVLTYDNIMQTTIAAGLMLGAKIASDAGDNPELLCKGLQIATATTAVACFLWSFGYIVKGEFAKGGKGLAVTAILLTALSLETNLRFALIKAATCTLDREKALNCEQNVVELNRNISNCNYNQEIIQLSLNACMKDLKTCESNYARSLNPLLPSG